MKLLKKILLIIPLMIVGIMLMVMGMFIMDRQDDYEVDLAGVNIPSFTESTIRFNQGNDFSVSLPFLASAIIDIDGDGIEELFLGGSQTTADGLFQFKENRFVQIQGGKGLGKGNVASYGSVVTDANGDGTQDLLVAREDGLWLHENINGSFNNKKLNAVMPEGSVPLSIAIADINRDGHFDMYVPGYIRHDLVEGQNIFREGYGGESRLFLNNGDNTFIDITEKSGLAYQHNAFQGAFIDIDRDGREDLIVAHDTGHVMTWKNKGDMHFERVDNPNSNAFSYPMGLGITDLGNDGLVDFFFSNVGSTAPNFMIRGDLTDAQVSNWKWMLFSNKGDFNFEDTAEAAKLADYEFSWGGVFEDLNLDGMEDLIVAENYIGCPPHKFPFLRLNGRLLLQTPNGEFASVEKASGVINRTYSITPLTADFNGDGRPDIVNANLNGDSKLFLSKAGEGNYLKVRLPNNATSIAATVKVKLNNAKILSRPYVSGEGLSSDSSHIMIFGLGDSVANSVSVTYIDGRTNNQTGVFKNELLAF